MIHYTLVVLETLWQYGHLIYQLRPCNKNNNVYTVHSFLMMWKSLLDIRHKNEIIIIGINNNNMYTHSTIKYSVHVHHQLT